MREKKSSRKPSNIFIIKISSFIFIKTEISAEVYASYAHRQVDWLNSSIIKNDSRFRYELRIISHPDHNRRGKAGVNFYLIIIADKINKAEFKNYTDGFFTLLENSFSEYEFIKISNSEYDSVLDPFVIKSSAEITRKVELIRLDTFKTNQVNQLGFSQKEISYELTKSNNSILHFSLFERSKSFYNILIKQLISISEPHIISITLQPCIVDNALIDFINFQVLLCERYAQLNISSSSDPEQIFPSLKERARLYQAFQYRFINTFNSNPLRMQIKLGSTDTISPIISNTFANIFSNGRETHLSRLQNQQEIIAGGFEYRIHPEEESSSIKESFKNVTLHIYRHTLLPYELADLLYVFDFKEASSAFSLPIISPENLEGLNIKRAPSLPAFGLASPKGVSIGLNIFGSKTQLISLNHDDRRRHMYIVGQTGTGKSSVLKKMILSDIENGEGLCVIDPHGDLYKDLLHCIPTKRLEDVVLIDPTDSEFPVSINLLEYKNESQRHFIAQEMVFILNKLLQDEYGPNSSAQFTGPIFYQHVKMNLLLVMSNPDRPGTLLDFYNIFQKKDYWKKWIPIKIDDPLLHDWVDNVLPQYDYLRVGGEGASLGAYINSKFEQFLFDPLLRKLFAQPHSTIDFNKIMDGQKILLINLAKGELSQINSRFLGLVIMAKLQSAALERAKIPKLNRKDFFVYVDEFQSIITENFVTLLSEGRKFRINLILANQFISQIPDYIINSIFGNVGTIVSFRVGPKDAEYLEKRFSPYVINNYLSNLPNWNAYVSTLINGQPIIPFSLRTIYEKFTEDKNKANLVSKKSRNKYSMNS